MKAKRVRNALHTSRRTILAAMTLGTIGIALRAKSAEPLSIEVWTGPNCSCCHGWIEHLEHSGFDVTAHDGGNSDARARLGMPVQYGSCHTGAVPGYAIEGHVPAREIKRLLAERPDAVGIAVPSMPRGSPGMDGPSYGGVRDPYDVLLVRRDGSAVVYQSYR
jgi:hypothetical protein